MWSAPNREYFKFCTFDRLYPIRYSKRNSNVCNEVFDKITQHNFCNKTLVAYTLNLLKCSIKSKRKKRREKTTLFHSARPISLHFVYVVAVSVTTLCSKFWIRVQTQIAFFRNGQNRFCLLYSLVLTLFCFRFQFDWFWMSLGDDGKRYSQLFYYVFRWWIHIEFKHIISVLKRAFTMWKLSKINIAWVGICLLICRFFLLFHVLRFTRSPSLIQ